MIRTAGPNDDEYEEAIESLSPEDQALISEVNKLIEEADTVEIIKDFDPNKYVMICLEPGCESTKLHSDDDYEWRVSPTRNLMIEQGMLTTMMGPKGFCPTHTVRIPPAAA